MDVLIANALVGQRKMLRCPLGLHTEERLQSRWYEVVGRTERAKSALPNVPLPMRAIDRDADGCVLGSPAHLAFDLYHLIRSFRCYGDNSAREASAEQMEQLVRSSQ